MSSNNQRAWRGVQPEIKEAARNLRKDQTPAERVLWSALRDRQLDGLKFRKQYPIEGFILDFYCPEYKLAIELDGGIHKEQKEYDEERTKRLQTIGIHVIRFTNVQVLKDLDSVLYEIRNTVKSL